MSENEDRFVLSTRKSLYKPIEIEIDKQVYQSVPLTRAVLKEINELDDAYEKNRDDDEPLYKVISLIFKVELKILEKIDKRAVQDTYSFFKRKFYEMEQQRAELILKSFEAVGVSPAQQVKKTAPNRKRPGSKP